MSYRIGGEVTQRPPASIDYSDYIPKYGDSIYWMNGPSCKLSFDTTKGRLHPASAVTLSRLCDDASDDALIEISGVT